ncbi:cadherin-like domain-containing protein [Sinorhizobium arboris]|uniref:cadherin-like domain-containing protein n=1 Tax=Sinorhizobium arboris TaxID=76745 RepID=UPI0003FB6C3F|nr:cadherin-like domain-containing protein [Sinorhizobium arboris]
MASSNRRSDDRDRVGVWRSPARLAELGRRGESLFGGRLDGKPGQQEYPADPAGFPIRSHPGFAGSDDETGGRVPAFDARDVAEPAAVACRIADDIGDGTLTFAPNVGYNGSTSFTYTISDGSGGTATATVDITIDSVNDTPSADPVGDVVRADGDSFTLDLSPFFTDPDGDPLNYVVTGLPAGLTYDPATGVISGQIDRDASQNGPNSDGLYTVTVTAYDRPGAAGLSATTSFDMSVSNPAPTAKDDAATTNEDTPVTISILENDSDPDGDPLSVTSANAGNGTVRVNADGTLTYTPAANYNGTDTITYTISDGNGGVSTSQVTVTVVAVNDAPVAEDIPDEADDDGQTKTGTAAVDLSSYFEDVDADDLTFSITGLPGGLSIDPDTGIVSGTIDNDASQGGPNNDGVYTVAVTADDGNGGTVTQTFKWVISNMPPSAVNDTLPGTGSVSEDAATTSVAKADGLLSNDSDPDGDAFSVTAVGETPVAPGSPATVTGSNGGTFVVNADGSYSFTPDGAFEDLQAGESRVTKINYTLTDTDGLSDTATLTVIVTGVNDAPTADADGLPDVTKADSTLLSGEDALDMSDYFQDAEGDTLTFSATGLPAGLSIDAATGEITGTIASNASTMSPYTVTITADDGQGGQVSAEFTFTVTNPAPTAENDAATTSEDTPVDIAVIGNDTDPDGDVLSVDTMVPPAAGNGTVTINADGTLHYVPDPDFYGTDTITYRVTDGQGGYSTGSVTVTVTAVNDPPVVDLDASGTGLGHGATFTEGDAPVAIADGDAAAFDAEDEIVRLDVTLGGFADGSAEVIGIGAADSVTVGVAGSGTVTFGDTTFAYRYDPATGLAFTNVSGAAVPMPGEDVTALLRAITYQSTTEDPTAGDRTLTFTARDKLDAVSAAATSTISVAPVNDAPVAADDTVVTDEDVPVTFDPRLNDTDVDGDPLTIGAINGQPIASGGSVAVESGTVTLNANGTLTFTPSANFVGTPSFTYTVNDGAGGTDTAVVLLTVNPVNDAPVANDDTASTVENTPVSGNVLHNLAGRDTDIDGDTLVVAAVNGSGANVGPRGHRLRRRYLRDRRGRKLHFRPGNGLR